MHQKYLLQCCICICNTSIALQHKRKGKEKVLCIKHFYMNQFPALLSVHFSFLPLDLHSFSSDLKNIFNNLSSTNLQTVIMSIESFCESVFLEIQQYIQCLQVKNSFANISEVNWQCLQSLGTRSEDDFEKVSTTNTERPSFAMHCPIKFQKN